MKKLIKLLKLNNLQYNFNRDPQVYRRLPGEPFRIQAWLEGSGAAACKITDAAGQVLGEANVNLPGVYDQEVRFSTPGVRVVTLSISAGGESVSENLRLDVLDHAWVG